jgi:uncharacterized protein YktB (UPF0637 family)
LSFDGFTQKEFAIFELQGYQARMPVLRAEITPRLKEFGPALAPRLEEATGLELHPHVAMHMRRTVNPPEETWAAFCRNTRSYKPYVHFRVSINGEGIHVKCFVEDDADDKATFADGLKRNAAGLVKYFAANPSIRSYDLRDANEDPRPGINLKKTEIVGFADRLKSVKGQHACFGILLGTDENVVGSRDSLTKAVIAAAQTLVPLYQTAAVKGYKLASG